MGRGHDGEGAFPGALGTVQSPGHGFTAIQPGAQLTPIREKK
jgi:hypothetical protein